MLLTVSKKHFTALFLLLLICAGCRFFQGSNTETPKPFAPEEIKSDIPFSTKEPEVFQAEIVIASGGSESKKFVVRSGNNRRFDYNVGAKNQVSVIQAEKVFTILPDKKIYTEANLSANFPAQNDLTGEWLNEKPDAEFTEIGKAENRTQYRVNLGSAEILIFVDESLNLPVRQEFYSLAGGQKTLTMTFELRNFKAEAASDLFVVQKDYKKVSAEEFRKVLQSEEYK